MVFEIVIPKNKYLTTKEVKIEKLDNNMLLIRATQKQALEIESNRCSVGRRIRLVTNDL